QPAGESEHNGLDNELGQHGGAACSHSHAQTDLLGALGDADQHDVHDANAPDEQADKGDAAKNPDQHVDELVAQLQEVVRADELKVVIRADANPPPLAHDLRYLLLGLFQVRAVGHVECHEINIRASQHTL